MDVGTVVAISSMGIALLALLAAIAQVNIQSSIEARRKGKTDKLAIGEWAITWPQARAMAFETLRLLHIPSPFGDPKILTVPFITVGALQDCLRNEAISEKRSPIGRRMESRLVESATRSIATGDGRFTGRMYAVRGTTRKRSEACWSDAMDMCGITRKYWPLMTGASALACDGAIRAANAVTNLHSLWGFARAMGLRSIEINGTRITMTNGGASIYLDQYAGVDRPTRLAHFSGSPNGRYNILEEMSQQTCESIYADAVWSDGCVPVHSRLEPKYPLGVIKDTANRRITWPFSMSPPSLARNDPVSEEVFFTWASQFLQEYKNQYQQLGCTEVTCIQLIEAGEPAIISCIRTYPKSELSVEQVQSCSNALLWCVQHWWRDPYQVGQLQRGGPDLPRVPLADITQISSEFVTGRAQAILWCRAMETHESVPVEPNCWASCCMYAELLSINQASTPILQRVHQIVLVKVLQAWKLHIFCNKLTNHGAQSNAALQELAAATSEMILLTMALLSISLDSSQIGLSEVNKSLEIELG
jgi:hypothetical protein